MAVDEKVAARAERVLRDIPRGVFVGGEWRDSASGRRFAVENPATGETLAEVADGTAEDGLAALDAASGVQETWARTAPRERAEILRAAFEEIRRRADDFAVLISLEMGKPLAEAYGEVAYGNEYLRWFSEETNHVFGRYSNAPDGRSRILTLKRPVGPALLITPWNFPLAMATRKIAPAIASGSTAVVKPARLTPLTTLLVTEVFREAGLPAGVLNVVPTSSASTVTSPILADARLRKVSFTGSTEVGRALLREAASHVLRTSMELGGNAPFVVFADADLDAAVEGAIAAKMRNGGEACTAANRFIVERAISSEFTERLAARIDAMPVGFGLDEGVQVGPLIEAKARDKVDSLVSASTAEGARVVIGGSALDRPGYFYAPTVLADVPADAEILREEIFGPVAPVVTFSTEDEAVKLANASPFGLMAYAYTADMSRGLRMAERIETGMLGLNSGVISNPAAPFGGVKESGLGREGGFEGIEEYLETTYVGIPDPFKG